MSQSNAGRRSAQTVIKDLAEMAGLTHKDTGKPNLSALGRETGIPVPTLSRIMAGEPSHSMDANTIGALCSAFHITFAQARGEAPIRRAAKGKTVVPTDGELALVRALRTIPPAERERLRDYVLTAAQIAAKPEPIDDGPQE